MAITDDRPLAVATEGLHRRELLPTAREVEQGATAAEHQFEQRPATKRSTKALLSSYLQTFDPRTIVGSKFPLFVLAGMAMVAEGVTLDALAVATEKVQLGTLVTGNTYRNPTLLAKAITTLDVISQGRAVLGIGTG